MELKVDVYYKSPNGSYEIVHATINESDIQEIAERKTKDRLPMWMGDDWKFDSITVDKIEL